MENEVAFLAQIAALQDSAKMPVAEINDLARAAWGWFSDKKFGVLTQEKAPVLCILMQMKTGSGLLPIVVLRPDFRLRSDEVPDSVRGYVVFVLAQLKENLAGTLEGPPLQVNGRIYELEAKALECSERSQLDETQRWLVDQYLLYGGSPAWENVIRTLLRT